MANVLPRQTWSNLGKYAPIAFASNLLFALAGQCPDGVNALSEEKSVRLVAGFSALAGVIREDLSAGRLLMDSLTKGNVFTLPGRCSQMAA